MIYLLIASAAFAKAFLGCFQAINVIHGRYIWLAITSVAIAASELTLFKTVPSVADVEGATAFVMAGVFGGQLSMAVTRKVRKVER